MKKWLTPLFVLGALLVFTACESTSDLVSRGLSIDVTKIERASDGSYAVTWQVVNPNVVYYVVDHSEHKIFLDGVLVGTISKSGRQGVPQQQRAEGTDGMKVASPAGTEKLAQAVGKGPVAYRVESNVWLLLAEENTTKSQLVSTGTVSVTAK
jgi:hypothetical protein